MSNMNDQPRIGNKPWGLNLSLKNKPVGLSCNQADQQSQITFPTIINVPTKVDPQGTCNVQVTKKAEKGKDKEIPVCNGPSIYTAKDQNGFMQLKGNIWGPPAYALDENLKVQLQCLIVDHNRKIAKRKEKEENKNLLDIVAEKIREEAEKEKKKPGPEPDPSGEKWRAKIAETMDKINKYFATYDSRLKLLTDQNQQLIIQNQELISTVKGAFPKKD